MITLTILILLTCIVANIIVYRLDPNDFNPIKHGLYTWMFWLLSTSIVFIAILCFIIFLILKYLP